MINIVRFKKAINIWYIPNVNNNKIINSPQYINSVVMVKIQNIIVVINLKDTIT